MTDLQGGLHDRTDVEAAPASAFVSMKLGLIGRFAASVVRRRRLTLAAIVLVTIGLLAGAGRLSIVIDPGETLPQDHPYLAATNLADRLFGSKFVVVVGITPRQGDALKPEVLAAVRGITEAFEHDSGVVRANLASLTAPKVKDIVGIGDELQVRPLLASAAAGRSSLEAVIARNPIYSGLLLSRDHRTTAVIAEFRKDADGFKAIAARVQAIVAPFRSEGLEIEVAGQPIFLGLAEVFSDRMALLFPLALLVIGLIHLEAFRSWQGLVLPLVTGLIATVWALGIMGWTGTPLDAFNATTPILILAVAAGHAVQILKRYHEEFSPLRSGAGAMDARTANQEAIVRALAATGPVMVAAGLTAAGSFASLLVFQITTIRIFGLFTALGILSALIIELTLIPALRAMLPPPGPRQMAREAETGAWDRLADLLARITMTRPRAVLAASLLFLAAASAGTALVKVNNSLRSFFLPSLEARQQDDILNSRLAGNNVLTLIVRGQDEDAIKSPAVLRAMDATQRFLEHEPAIGKTVSLVDFIRQIDRAMNADSDPARPLPDSQDLIAQYLLLYSLSGGPSDFDAYVDSGYRNALVTAYLREEDSLYLADLSKRLHAFVANTFPPGVEVMIGGNVMSPVALNEVLVGNKLLNIAQIVAAVFLVSSVLFRSALGGLFVLVPLVLAVAGNFGLMGWAGIPLQVATATVSAMAVGIGADYAIYMLYRLRSEAALVGPEAALQRTFRSAGKAVMFVATAIAGGYAVVMLSWGFLIHFWLGLLISAAMIVSAVATLTTLPALAMLLRPAFLFGRANPALRSSAVTLGALVGLMLSQQPAQAQGVSATEIMRRNFVATKMSDTSSEATFTLISADGQQRVRRTQSLTKLREDGVSNMRLTRFLSPSDVRGTATLTIENASSDDDIWIYLPALKRVRRLLASNKKDSFVGTDFSYGDIIGFKVDDWRHAVLRQEAVNGAPCYVVESVPATAAAKEDSGYSRRLQWIRLDNFVTVQGQYSDISGRLWKVFSASNLVSDQSKSRWQPLRLESKDVQANHSTVVQFENFKSNTGLSADLFSARVLDREP